jgi:formylglycine-generating enzyme required for sulfatase activity
MKPAVCRNTRLSLVALLAAAWFIPGATVFPASADEKVSDTRKAFLREFVLAEFVEITPGKGRFPASFAMGSEAGTPAGQPVHEVTIDHAFHIARGEVSQNLYAVVMGRNPSKWKGARNSAEMFTFGEALEFCRRLTQLLGEAGLLANDEEIRLPTEAEWEYCCRAGTTTAYSFGDSAVLPGDAGNKASALDAYAWHTGNAAGNDPPVGAKKPNAWGLYDMHGYLWEFVADPWHDNYDGAPKDGRAWTTTEAKPRRVVRGGSWKDRHEHLTSAARRAVPPDAADDAIGFRCVRAKIAPR